MLVTPWDSVWLADELLPGISRVAMRDPDDIDIEATVWTAEQVEALLGFLRRNWRRDSAPVAFRATCVPKAFGITAVAILGASPFEDGEAPEEKVMRIRCRVVPPA